MWSLDLVTTKELAKSLAIALEDFAQESAVAIFEDRENESIWRVQLTIENEPNVKELQHLTNLIATELKIPAPVWTLEKLPEIDWLSENRKLFPPLKIGSFYIYGSHETTPLPHDTIPLKVDASTAFGTGSHPTTSGCLLALETLAQSGYKPHKALDLGCGTGILAMGMARLFDCSIIASDIDPEAVDKTIFNIEENYLTKKISAIVSAGFDDPILKSEKPFDLIAANILAKPLIELASEIINALSSNGILVLSGILNDQAESVTLAYIQQGCTLKDHNQHQEWSVLVLKK